MLSYNDIMLDFDNMLEKNSIISAIFGNLVIASIVIVLLIIVIFHIHEGMAAKIIYGFVTVFCCLLVIAKLIKSQYVSKNVRAMDTQFSSWMQSNASSPLVIPKNKQIPSTNMSGSADVSPLEFNESELVENVNDVDVDNFLYGQSSSTSS